MLRDLREYFAGCGYYLMRREDVGAFVDCVSEAYLDYPLTKWFYGCDERISRIVWRSNILTLMRSTVIFATSEKAEGFAIVAPEGFVGESTLGFIINGGYKVPISALLRMSRYESYIKRQRMKFVGRDCIYFYNLSVRNDCQGKGIGSGLMNSVLRYCDEARIPCYFETHTEKNVSLYRHLGVSLLAENPFPGCSWLTHRSMMYTPPSL